MTLNNINQPFKELRAYETYEATERKTNNKEIIEWLQKIPDVHLSKESLASMIIDHEAMLGNKNEIDPHDEMSPYYNFFLAHAYGFLRNLDAATKNIETSVSGFKKLGKTGQQAISCWFHGLLLCNKGEFEKAKAKISDALNFFSDMADEEDGRGEYGHKNYIIRIRDMVTIDLKAVDKKKAFTPKTSVDSVILRSKPKHKIETNTNKSPKSVPPYSSQASGYISIPWLPIFQSVSAGPNGIVIMDAPSNANVTLNTIDIYDIPHNIYPIKKMDHQVTLNQIFTYGLVKVEGNSMNNAQPVRINDGDYVLFSKQKNSEENDIVIASRRIPNGEFAYMVKRHKKRDNLLTSETSDENSILDYAPIEINQDYQILGVVIAVAKA